MRRASSVLADFDNGGVRVTSAGGGCRVTEHTGNRPSLPTGCHRDAWPTRRGAMLLLGALAIPARGQQPSPVIGFLGITAPRPRLVSWFLEGLAESGYRDGETVTIKYLWADSHLDRLPALAADLLRSGAVVLVTIGGTPAAQAARTASASVPVVFEVGRDPHLTGLVASLNRPGGNSTGVFIRTGELNPKRLQLLHEMVPRARVFAVLVSSYTAEATENEMRAAAIATGVELLFLRANSEREIDAAFSNLEARRVGALIVSNSSILDSHQEQLVALASRHKVPTIFEWSDFVSAGGLMSYGTDRSDAFRTLGRYASRILRGARPAELPVFQSERFELVINRRTAAKLGLTMPASLLQSADKVID